MVDWDLAVATGRKLRQPRPDGHRRRGAGGRRQLRDFAAEAHGHVAGVHRAGRADRRRRRGRGRRPAGLDPGQRRRLPDRARAAGREDPAEAGAPSSPVADAVGSQVTGVEVGALLGFLAAKVLGQFDLFPPTAGPGRQPGRLLLVAPNIVARRARARASTRTTSGSGSACTRRPTGCSSPRCRGCATTCIGEIDALVGAIDLDPARSRRAARRRARARLGDAVRGDDGRQPRSTLVADPGAARDPRPAHRGDVAARGPRRRRDGRRRARR